MNNTTEKRCTKCGETKLLEYFHVEAKENMRKNAKFDGDFQPSLPLAI